MKSRIVAVFSLFIVFSNVAFAELSDLDGYRFFHSVDYLYNMGIVNGYPDGTFRPGKMINRAELTKMVVEGFYYGPFDDYADNCFSDVKADDWFAGYVCFAKEHAFVDGYPDGSFRPEKNITQPEALKIIYDTLEEYVPESGDDWFDMYLNYSEDIGMYYFNSNDPADYQVKRGEIAYFINWLTNYNTIDQIMAEEFYGGEVDYSYDAKYSDYNFYYDDFEYDETFATYSIKNDDLSLISGNGAVEHQKIWNYFAEMIPAEYREYITEFIVFTDGENGTLAMVDSYLYYDDDGEPIDEEWSLNVDLEDAFKNGELYVDTDDVGGLTYTLVHEFGHVLTLNLDQVDPVFWETEEEYQAAFNECEGIFIIEGCAYKDSYLNDFYEEFWTEVYDEWDEIQYIADDYEYYDALYDFYLKYEDQFVNDYAATDLGEDMAESFAYFVVQDEPDGDTVWEEKMLFFYNYPEFVEIRDSIRDVIY